MFKIKDVPKPECCSADLPDHDHSHEHEHEHSHVTGKTLVITAIISFILLISGLALDYWIKADFFKGYLRFAWYFAAYLPVGFPVIRDAYYSMIHSDFFSEFFLMSIATIGAFAIGEFPEAVAVMLFYTIGEAFQDAAVSRATNNIKSLLDERPDEVTVLNNGIAERVKAETVQIDQIIQLRPGEKLGLDGVLLTERGSFNTSALTGESVPDTKTEGEEVLAGMINLNTVSQVKVTKLFSDSKLSRILELVQNAESQKAPTELFIRRFAKVYTPIVVFLAVAITLLPYFFVADYQFKDWLYRALIFLVISCPCALLISIPLGYFGGIGAASRNGILVKGGNYLDTLSEIDHVVMDKTGTLTEGIFQVQEIKLQPGFDQDEIMNLVNVLESNSTHPVATAIHEYVGPLDPSVQFEKVEEIAGHGLKAEFNGKTLLVGNFKLLDKFDVSYDPEALHGVLTQIAIAYDQKFAGYLTIADSIKADAQKAIDKLHHAGLNTVMLSGDKTAVVEYVAEQLGINSAYGDLLPEDKVNKVKEIKGQGAKIAFVGDGINDAPVIAISDVGLAMGGLGSDAAIETANVVIQDDKPSKIPVAINIGKATKRIVWQNIGLAFGVKVLVLILGAGGIATMWEAVFADVGVALLAILNAIRIQRMKFIN